MSDFDATLKELRHVVQQLEKGDLTLEQALEAYERGVRLAAQGQAHLSSAEARVDVLSQQGATMKLPPPDSGRNKG